MMTEVLFVCVVAIGVLLWLVLNPKERNVYEEAPVEKPKEEQKMLFNVNDKVKVYRDGSWCCGEDSKLLDGKVLARKMSYDPRTCDYNIEYVVKCGKEIILTSENNLFPIEGGKE